LLRRKNAFPILSALEIPATIFLSTGYIATQQTFWYDRLARLLADFRWDTVQRAFAVEAA